MDDFTFESIVEWKGGFASIGKARDFTITIDEPPELGGEDKGPNPVEYLLMALGGCSVIIGQVVAKELGIKIDALKVKLSGTLNPDKFLGKPTNERAGFKEIVVELEVKSDAPKEKLEEWKRIFEERCPVGDNLRNPTPVKIVLK